MYDAVPRRTEEFQSQTVDVGQCLEHGEWSPVQKAVTALAALAIIFDGFDNQVIAYAVPAILRDWQLTRAAIAPVLAAGLLGVTIGTAIGGILGDRFGRKYSLIGSVIVFAVATTATSTATTVGMLGVLRFLTGAGIGAALPNASALTAEFTPYRWRPVAVTLMIVCIPLGGILAGAVAARVLPTFGWRVLFSFGGIVPLVFAFLLFFLLPESPRYLVRHPHRWPELRRLLGRMGQAVAPSSTFSDIAEEKAEQSSTWAAIFGRDYLRDTLGLWLAFFCCLICIYLSFSWLPTLLAAEGFDLGSASSGLLAYNIGGVIGAVGCALLVTRIGSRMPMITGSVFGLITALGLNFVGFSPGQGHVALLLSLGVHGLFVNAVQSTLYALAAHVYTTKVRARGVASAATVGRLGAVLSTFLGARALQAGHSAFFAALASAMAGTIFGLLIIKRHIVGRDVAEIR